MSTGEEQERLALLQGTLDLLILRRLIFGSEHGQGIARAIQETSCDELLIEHGALYPAAAARSEGMDQRGLGHFREQPPGPLLYIDESWPETTRARVDALAGIGCCDRSCARI